jgi:hypothetical protein
LGDREAAEALALMGDGGVALTDLGYRGNQLAEELATETGLLLITTADAGAHRPLICSLRERVETFFAELWKMFIDRVYSRSWNGLWNTIKLKLVAYTELQTIMR